MDITSHLLPHIFLYAWNAINSTLSWKREKHDFKRRWKWKVQSRHHIAAGPHILICRHRLTTMGLHLHTLYCKRWTSIKDDWTDQPSGYSLGRHNLANGTNNNLTWHISFLLPLIDACLLSNWPPLTTSLQPYKVCCSYHLPRKLYNFSKFYWLHDLYTTLTTNHHILYNLHSDKEQGGEECRKRTKFFFLQIYCWTLRYWPEV